MTLSDSWMAFALIAGLALGLGILFTRARSNGQRDNSSAEGNSEFLSAGLLPLVDCPRNHDACLRCINVDRCIVHRLLELGLTPGTEVRVVQDAGGPMLVSVRGSRVALGRDLAENMWVELAGPPVDNFPVA